LKYFKLFLEPQCLPQDYHSEFELYNLLLLFIWT